MPTDPTAPDRPLPGAPFALAFARFWQRYAVFSGRASRSEYWWAALGNTLIAIALGLVLAAFIAASAALAQAGSGAQAVTNALAGVVGLLLVVFWLAQIVPGIAVSVRRLHDAGFSGWLYLLSLIPSVGGLILLVFHVLPSERSGERFDRGAAAWAPASAASAIPVAAPSSSTPFDAWPAPAQSPVTAPVPRQQPADAAGDPVRDAWSAVGTVTDVDTRVAGRSSWKRVGYLAVERPDGIGVLTTSGLAAAEGAAALGPGAEVYLPSTALVASRAADDWTFGVLAAVARRVGASGMHLPSELEQHGALSMAVPVDAPQDWRAPDGAVGVLIGLPLDGVPETVATPAGEVRLVGVVPLRPEELQRILDGGREARTAIAGDLNALPASTLASPDRPAV